MRVSASAEEFSDRIPPKVMAAAKAMLLRLMMSPHAESDTEIIDGWALEPYGLGYSPPTRRDPDIMDMIVQTTAYDELEERLEEAVEERYGETFQLGDARKDGAVVLLITPKKWWTVPSLEALAREGLLTDYTSGNDACPSLGAELQDGYHVHIFTGHPHPEHHTRQDGCDPRFAIYEYRDDDENPPGDVVWSGESEREAAAQVKRIIEKHGGARRQLYKA